MKNKGKLTGDFKDFELNVTVKEERMNVPISTGLWHYWSFGCNNCGFGNCFD